MTTFWGRYLADINVGRKTSKIVLETGDVRRQNFLWQFGHHLCTKIVFATGYIEKNPKYLHKDLRCWSVWLSNSKYLVLLSLLWSVQNIISVPMSATNYCSVSIMTPTQPRFLVSMSLSWSHCHISPSITNPWSWPVFHWPELDLDLRRPYTLISFSAVIINACLRSRLDCILMLNNLIVIHLLGTPVVLVYCPTCQIQCCF